MAVGSVTIIRTCRATSGGEIAVTAAAGSLTKLMFWELRAKAEGMPSRSSPVRHVRLITSW